MRMLKPGENAWCYYLEQLSELFSVRIQNGELGYVNCDDLGILKRIFPKQGKFELDYAGKTLFYFISRQMIVNRNNMKYIW